VNITLSIDETILRKARLVAQSMDKSLNQLIREYLEQLTTQQNIERDIAELRQLSAESQGHSQGWRCDREELHERA
jgi:hypothetical protein